MNGCEVSVRRGHQFLPNFVNLVIPKDLSPEESAFPVRTADSSPLKWSEITELVD